jgi:AcrR family transcriptional regulator
MPKAAKPKAARARRRLDAGAARALILDATEKRLAEVGPAGIRLQDVATHAGVSHPTVLHHFGSRELLVKAVITRALHSINAALVATMNASSGDHEQLATMIENVALALEKNGHGRMITWLALEGHHFDGAEVGLADVVDATHALRLERTKRAKKPTREDTARTVVLASIALVGGSVLAPTMLKNAGLGADPRASFHFRSWLARLLLGHFDA